ncbi:flagellar biosynthesis anti-sigma factor FlgM [Sporosarcina limicola]|uniref:Negative regulator of flagellin synthesis n=1 Tax=Sporosarcina limicola TaxID=34101 RepID=A0A927MKV4_9BACL|nr:flagellar biosynthesis anti-sigma factor FlgM [Sporosarcina limicola]MBE1555007.1 negative regulator of flagellin synthesis FlgM [Sporosarcina limicola]
MKIQNINLPAVNPYKANQLKAEQNEHKTKMKTDKLEISTAAKQLSELSTFPAERNERVQQIKAQVQSGMYEVDVQQLASNLANHFKV